MGSRASWIPEIRCLGRPSRKNRRGAPKGKRPLTVIIDEKLIEEAKIAAIEEKTNVSRVAEELLRAGCPASTG